MIIVSGFNVYPNEVEDVIASHPDIVEVAAIGVPDAKTSEIVKVFVTTTNKQLTEADVKAFARENLTAYKVPRFVEFRDELPKTNVGKIRSEEHTSELQSRPHLVCRLLLEKKKTHPYHKNI